jgi:glutamate dehydrogenase (NAD(P)+)
LDADIESISAQAENEPAVPEAVHTFFRSNGDVLGHLVIDSKINALSAGGIRMVPSMPVADLCHLARAMTLKFSFLKWPFGGAKAAIITHRADLSAPERTECVRLFAEQLRPFRGRYLPGEDAGTNADDLRLINRVARLEREHAQVDSGSHTASTVRICVEQMAQDMHLGPRGCTVAIEGFGKVGGWVGRQLAELGCRVIAVSTARGAIYHPDGLDVTKLLELRHTAGDDCLNRYADADRIEPGELLRLPVDFLAPCALSWSVSQANAADVNARVIVCGANNPVTGQARRILAENGVTYVPDFVSNCGGVLGSIIETLCRDRTKASRMLRRQFEPKVQSLLARSRSERKPLEEAAKEIAAANRQEMQQRATCRKSGLFSLMEGAFRLGLVPQTLVKAFGPRYVRKTMA